MLSTNKQVRDSSKGLLKGNWGTAIFLMIVSGIVTGLIDRFLQIFGLGIELSRDFILNTEVESLDELVFTTLFHSPGRTFLYMFINQTLQSLFNYGVEFGYLEMIDGEPLKLESLFSAFTYKIGRNFLVIILVSVIRSIAYALFVIPGIWFDFAILPVAYVLYDYPDLPAADVVRQTVELMKGHKWNVFCLTIPYYIMPGLFLIAGGILTLTAMASERLAGLRLLIGLGLMIIAVVLSVTQSIKIRAAQATYYRYNIVPQIEE